MEIPLIAHPVRRVEGKVHRAAKAVRNLLAERPREFQPLRPGKFLRQRDFVLARHARVLALLCELGRIPKLLPPDPQGSDKNDRK